MSVSGGCLGDLSLISWEQKPLVACPKAWPSCLVLGLGCPALCSPPTPSQPTFNSTQEANDKRCARDLS